MINRLMRSVPVLLKKRISLYQLSQIPSIRSSRSITFQANKNPPYGFIKVVLMETDQYLYRLYLGNENSLEKLEELFQTIAEKLSLSDLKLD